MIRLPLPITIACALACVSPVWAQTSGRLEAGLGFGSISQGSGPNARLGIAVGSGKWGVLFRYVAHDGGAIKGRSGFFGPPSESFTEGSFLLTRAIGPNRPNSAYVGLGAGAISGRKLDSDTSREFVDLDPTWGVALELGIDLGDGHGVGVSTT